MKIIFFILFQFLFLSIFSQERNNHFYKFKIQGITNYAQAKPYFDDIRLIYSESKSNNHNLLFDSNEESFKVHSTINFNRNKLTLELEKIGLVLRDFYIDGKSEE
jgi:hypothetical protein